MIKCLKLITGEEVIGEYEETDMGVSIKNAAIIMMMPNPTGKLNIGLVPFLPYSESDVFEINREHVMITHGPSTDLINNYNRLYGSGIQIASAV